jgi:hypothetical protein
MDIITPEQRSKKNALAFLDHLAGAAGYEARPAGLLTLQQVELLGLKFSAADRAALSRQEAFDQINVYFFLQTAPLKQVARAVRAFCRAEENTGRQAAWDDLLCDHVEPFLASELSPEMEVEMNEQLDQLGEVVAAQVDAQPPPSSGASRREHLDPNS